MKKSRFSEEQVIGILKRGDTGCSSRFSYDTLQRLAMKAQLRNQLLGVERSEFTKQRMIRWAEDVKVELVHIQPGRPMQNGHVESFHGRLRDECLNTIWFRTPNDVRCTLSAWRREYNTERPHSSLDYGSGKDLVYYAIRFERSLLTI